MRLLYFYLLCLPFLINSQEITKKELVGVWETTNVIVNTKMFKEVNQKKLKIVEDGFMGSQFSFSKNGLMRINLNENAPEPFSDEMFSDVYYFNVKQNSIQVGSRKKSSNIMVIHLEKEDDEYLYFDLVGVKLKVKKIASSIKLKLKKNNKKQKKLPSRPLLFQEINENEIVHFNKIDTAPISPDCLNVEKVEDQKKCTARSVGMFFNRRFNTDLAGDLGLTGLIEIESYFIINTEGEVVNIVVDAPQKKLIVEVKRVINLLPKFKPAKHNGKAVNTKYSLPVKFQIHD